ncbi:polysaccharide biosynthesis/export family protein [Brevundimonas sp.]|uniref:polysaccharide biosynthesis/export family protein n=1 Tax=Brevundimonas sp. TaxID=1871086 RepID=UPI0028A67BC9|nr:polysaccharide biosynthesis/export family protein [Brevundimonas sp.]
MPEVLPQAAAQEAAQPSYRVGPFDLLQVNVFGVPELSGAAQVDGDGRLTLPLIGGMDAMGMTPPQLAMALEDAYGARFVRDPSITVQVTTPQSQRLVVSGAVKEPGIFPVQGRVTLTQAVAQAKGLGDYADQSNVVVLRDIGGQQAAARFDLREIEAGRMADPELAPGDTVIVDTARARRLIRDLAPLGTLFAVFRVFG